MSRADFELFWGWYGRAAHQLKNSKNLHAMWSKGVFWGFASRAEAERAVLAEGVPGVFVLRFSETNPGAFAACYSAPPANGDGGLVAYHLLFPSNAVTQHHSLSDAVRDAPELEHVLVVSFDDLSVADADPVKGREPWFKKMDKTTAFNEFYSNHKPSVNKNGYVIK